VEFEMKELLAAALVVAVAVVSPAPSRADDYQAPAPGAYQGDGGTLRMTSNPVGTSAFGVYAMQKFKLDEKYGFKFQILPSANSQATMTAFLSGSSDMLNVDIMALTSMRNAGIKLIAVDPMFRWGDAWVVPAESPIKNLGDLKGKKIGTDSRANSTWFVAVAAAQKLYHLDLEKETLVQAAGVSLLRGLIEQGQLDATYMYNNIVPAMTATGKFRVLSQMRDLISAIGLDGDVPFEFQAVSEDYAAAHPANVRAYLAAYREAVHILNVNDDVWLEAGRSMKMDDAAIPPLRDEMRRDLMSKFEPDTEAAVRNIFDVLLATAGAKALGTSKLPDLFMTTQYQ
jgi:NitT/TauT family transport system substrate-binding protein